MGQAVIASSLGSVKPAMQALQKKRVWPSGAPVWLGSLRICFTMRERSPLAFVAFVVGAVAVSAVAVVSPAATLQKRQPLQATPFMTALPAALRDL